VRAGVPEEGAGLSIIKNYLGLENMKEKKELRKRKMMENRCPECGSSQVRHRKFLNNWICQKCGFTFKEPKSDFTEEP
jgi:ribosomal protein L37AE/L43A